MENPLGMRGLAFVQLAGPRPDDLHRTLQSLGFSRTHRHRAGSIDAYQPVSRGVPDPGSRPIRFYLDHDEGSFADRFQREHGPSIPALGLAFEDPGAAFSEAVRRGAVAFDPRTGGRTCFDAPAVVGLGGSLLFFVDDAASYERELVTLDRPDLVPDRGFVAVDHLTNNVHQGTLGMWSDFYRRIFGFTEVRSFDIEGSKTGLYSYALRSPCGTFCIPINEDKGTTGQIAEYLREYRGPGVQHLALLTRDILGSLDALGGTVETLDMDSDYYEEAFRRVPRVREDRQRIRDHQVLVDGDADGYLLQIFTKNLIGPIFFEIIQRENHLSFGEGNFSALFRSIERDQERRGVLV
jgi:4-hydroxyphenylpyruvate dioxygenase